jgi:hypothetical protein
LDLKDKDQRNGIVCSLIGHSKIISMCFGYVHCGRCGDQIGDTLMSGFPSMDESVIMNHNCPTCQKNYKLLTWKDKLYTSDPFAERKAV